MGGLGLSENNKASHRVQFQRSFGLLQGEDLSFPLLDRVVPLINAMDSFPRKCKYPQHFTEGGGRKRVEKRQERWIRAIV